MYSVDDQDRVVELEDIPQSSVGAPNPQIMSVEGITVVSFYTQQPLGDWDGRTVQIVDRDTDDELVAIVRFRWCRAIMFGPPNDEAFAGHPLASRGLGPYGTFLIENSSWLRGLERMNSVHPSHQPRHFDRYKHFVLSFHDSTFECIADNYDWEIHPGSINSILPKVLEKLR